MIRALLVTILAAAAGCGGKKADCAAVGDRAIALIRAELEHEGEGEERAQREGMLPALKEELVDQCKAEKWNETVRRCVIAADSVAALERCDPDASSEPAPGAEGDEAAPDPEPEPAPEGEETAPEGEESGPAEGD
jgi:small lipoprotein (TIGR04454 family)